MVFSHCNYLFAENVNHIVIYDMPQDLRDFLKPLIPVKDG